MNPILPALLLSGLLALSACGGSSGPPVPPPPGGGGAPPPAVDPPADGKAWTCPDHVLVRLKDKGPCPAPKCEKTLVKESSLDRAEPIPGHLVPSAEGEGWTCPMHRHVRAHEKGRCPECKMFLVEESSLAKVVPVPEGKAAVPPDHDPGTESGPEPESGPGSESE